MYAVGSVYFMNKLLFAEMIEELELQLLESHNAPKRRKVENSSLQGDITSLQRENASLQRENASLQRENASLQGGYASLQHEITSLQGENASLKDENSSLKEAHEREITALKEQLRLALASNN
jgi:cell division protein FtsB